MGRYVKSKYYQLQRWRKCSNDLVEKKLNSLLITSGWTGRSSTSYEILLFVFFLCHYCSVGEQRVNLYVHTGKSNKALSAELEV